MPSSSQRRDLVDILSRLAKSDKIALELFLSDVLTGKEFDDIARRWQLIKELHQGTPQRAIAKKLKMSIAKVTRGSSAIKKGKGFGKALRLKA